MKVSIVIVTRNRADDLGQTLESLRHLEVPSGIHAELVVVDNGSTDHTPQVVSNAGFANLSVRHLIERQPGKSRGLNLAIAETDSDLLLFTDDDVRVPPAWLAAMVDPIANGKVDVVAGGMDLAPHLLRPWMTAEHRSWLASSEWLEQGVIHGLVGANMAVSRRVFERVAGFDTELGGGALGFCEDGLFADQLREAGFQFAPCFHVRLVHHPDPSRLSRAAWLDAAERRGRSHAYRGHHWEHWRCRFGRLKILLARRRLAAWRRANPSLILAEGCHMEELNLVFSLGVVTGHVMQAARPRRYERRGLRPVC